MVAELLTTEFGSVGFADAEEIALEKSYTVEKTDKATSNSKIDYKAFCLKQGVTDEEDEQAQMIQLMEQRQLTTEEFEEELADKSTPMEL